MKKFVPVLFALSLVCIFHGWSYADNSRFYGVYTTTETIGSCDPETDQVTVGNDWDRRMEDGYGYIHSSDTSFTWSYIEQDGDKVTKSYIVSGNKVTEHSVKDYSYNPNYQGVNDREFVFSSDYNTAIYAGYRTYNFDPGPGYCQGAITGSLTRVDGAFKWVNAFSQAVEYDQTDFPDRSAYYIMLLVAAVDADPPKVNPISVTANGVGTLEIYYSAAWQRFLLQLDSPPPGPVWQTTYLFESGTNSMTLDLSAATFRKLSIPEVTISGRTVSWNPVEHASKQEVWIYPLTPDGYPDTSGAPSL